MSADQLPEEGTGSLWTAVRAVTSPDHRWSVTLLVAVTWFVLYGGRLVIPALAVQIQSTLHIDNPQFGLAVTVMWAGYSAMQFPSGILGDDWGYRTVLVGGSFLMGVGFVTLTQVSTFSGFLVAISLAGIGTGMLSTPSMSLLSKLFGDEKGRALGVVNAAGDASGVVAPVAATAVLLVATWQFPFVVLGVVGVGLALAFHALLRGQYRLERPSIVENVRGSGREILRSGIPVVLLTYSVYAFAWQALSAFIPLYVYETKGFSQGGANGMLALFFLAGMVVKPVAGWLSDHVSRGIIAPASMFFSGIVLFVLATAVNGHFSVLLAIAAFGTALMAFPPVMQAYLMDLFEGEQMGGAVGLSRTVLILLGSVGPAVVGYGSEVASYDAVFVGLSAALVVSAVALFATMRYLKSG